MNVCFVGRNLIPCVLVELLIYKAISYFFSFTLDIKKAKSTTTGMAKHLTSQSGPHKLVKPGFEKSNNGNVLIDNFQVNENGKDFNWFVDNESLSQHVTVPVNMNI